MQLAVSCEQLVSYSCCNDTCCTTSLAIHGYDKLNNGSFPCRWCVIVFMVFKFLWVNTQYSVNAFDIWYVRLRIDRVVATICSMQVCVKGKMRSWLVYSWNIDFKLCPSSCWAVDCDDECRASYKVKQLNHVSGGFCWTVAVLGPWR